MRESGLVRSALDRAVASLHLSWMAGQVNGIAHVLTGTPAGKNPPRRICIDHLLRNGVSVFIKKYVGFVELDGCCVAHRVSEKYRTVIRNLGRREIRVTFQVNDVNLQRTATDLNGKWAAAVTAHGDIVIHSQVAVDRCQRSAGRSGGNRYRAPKFVRSGTEKCDGRCIVRVVVLERHGVLVAD